MISRRSAGSLRTHHPAAPAGKPTGQEPRSPTDPAPVSEGV